MNEEKYYTFVYQYPGNKTLKKQGKKGPFFVDFGKNNDHDILINMVKSGKSTDNVALDHAIKVSMRFGGVVCKRPLRSGSKEEAEAERDRLIALYLSRGFKLVNSEVKEEVEYEDEKGEEEMPKGTMEDQEEEFGIDDLRRRAETLRYAHSQTHGQTSRTHGGKHVMEKRYEQLIRILAIGVAIALWFVSVQFSASGFEFVLPEYAWIGYLLAISVTVIELVFNEEGMEHTLTIVAIGILSYMYGIASNIIGIWEAQGSIEFSTNPASMIFPVLLGTFLEIAPEPLLLWGLIGTGARDILAGILSDRNKSKY